MNQYDLVVVGSGRCVLCCEAQDELGSDLVVAEQEGPFVELLASQPPGDLVVALARVARPTRRRDVGERVPPAA